MENNKKDKIIFVYMPIAFAIIIMLTLLWSKSQGYCAGITPWKIKGKIFGSNNQMFVSNPTFTEIITGDSLDRDCYVNQGTRDVTWYLKGNAKKWVWNGSSWVDNTAVGATSVSLTWNWGSTSNDIFGYTNFGEDVYWQANWRGHVYVINASNPNVSLPLEYDNSIKQYIAIAGSINNGIVLDMSDMGEDAIEFDITISGKRPTLDYMNAVKNAIALVPIGRPNYNVSLDSVKNWLLEYDGHLVYQSYKSNSISIFSKQNGIIPSYSGSYDLIFTATGTIQDGYLVITPTVEEWLSYNRASGGIYTPSVENEPYYFGGSTINTIAITPKIGSRIGKTTYSKFDNDGNLTTYYSINGLLSDVSEETLNDTYVEASQTQIEALQKEIDDLKAQYNSNMKEYISSQLNVSTDDTGILGGFSDILSTIGGLTASVGGISAMFALFFSCLPAFVLQIISFTIVSLCIISIYKALRG